MDKHKLLEDLVSITWDIATKAREGGDPREVEFLLENLEQRLAKALGVKKQTNRNN
jgi:hypothetical protein